MMRLEFRRRDYKAEEQSHCLPRVTAGTYPLSAPSHSSSPRQVNVSDEAKEKENFFDRLRSMNGAVGISTKSLQHEEINSDEIISGEISSELQEKEWNSFTKILMQRSSVSKKISLSAVSSTIIKGGKEKVDRK